MNRIGIDIGSDTIKTVIINEDNRIEELEPLRIAGKPVLKLKEILLELDKRINVGEKVLLGITGSGASRLSKVLDMEAISEIDSINSAADYLGKGVGHVIEIGAETQKYLSFYYDKKSGRRILKDVIPGTKCAGGTGSFLDYMHRRLKYDSLEEFIEKGFIIEDPASISGRCAVFAESDIVHHYQKGTSRDRIVAGIHQAVARNCLSLLRKSEPPENKIAFIGGVARNKCIIKHLINELDLKEDQVVVPESAMHIVAVGSALRGNNKVDLKELVSRLDKWLSVPFEYESAEAIKFSESLIMDDNGHEEIRNLNVELASLGVDIGSVSTKAAVITQIDGEYKVLAQYYRRTEGNPIEAVKDTLEKIRTQLKDKNINIKKMISATTGSGRYLTGYFISANEIKDEITAQAFGVSTFIKEEDLSVVEIGGQDSKFIRLKDGVISDFEMNWACAAGTGALIEKHAKNLDIRITDFGDLALKGDKPPIINSTCAVFSEGALLYFQQNNVSVENLCAGACLASAKNYLIKVVRNRQMGEKVAFQGAVAFNKGMIGAFETVLNRPIIVPPYPHLTGAIGVARIAYQNYQKNPTQTSFRGFDEIQKMNYSLTNFFCKHCGNECSVNMFKVGQQVFYQGDRCDRYSGQHKKSLGENIPDLFEEREKMLFNAYTKTAPEGSKTVGYPAGLMFNEFYPLFNAFFTELGFKVVTSGQSHKRIIKKGIEKTVAEPCFPIKVAHGHVQELLEQKVDYLFIPAIFSTEKPHGNYELCVTCPYLQSFPDVVKSALKINETGTKLLAPELFFQRGTPHIERKMMELAKEMGKKPDEAKKALKVGLNALEEFRNKIAKRGEEILKNLPPDQMAFVIVGRPYALHDPGVNMNVGKKVRDEGYLAIPLDFLPIGDSENDPSDTWTNIYSAQGQKKIASARFIKRHPNLHALVITYFGCGPDAFLDQMFYEELNRQYLTVQIDEHTSDTGILTRIQAHLTSAETSVKLPPTVQVRAESTPLTEVIQKKKRLWIPYMNEGARVMASVMKAHGIDAEVLPRSDDPSLSLARKYISGDVCIPMLYTTQDMLYRAIQPDFDASREAFFQGKSGGPCRYGMYFMIEKVLLEKVTPADVSVDMVTLGNINTDGGLGSSFLIMVFDALLAHDMLEKMWFHTRPYEVNGGDSEKVFLKYIDEIMKEVQNPANKLDNTWKMAGAVTGASAEYLVKILKKAMKEFQAIPRKDDKRPLVGVVGEFFVRHSRSANMELILTLEQMGCEVWMAPMTEFFGYSNYITGVVAQDQWEDTRNPKYLKLATERSFLTKIASAHEHKLFEAVKEYVGHLPEITPEETVKLGEEYITKFFGGEAILSMGKSEDFAKRGLDGVVNVGPFNCMPSLVVSALSRDLRKKHNQLPFLSMDYDGFEDNTREQRLSAFVSQVKDRFRNLREKEYMVIK